MTSELFEQMLTGGHPNSLGRTIEVVDIVLADRDKLDELFNCYFSGDEVVRLRTSSAIKRVTREHPEWLVPYADRLLDEISKIDQASTQWTLATLFQILFSHMNQVQKDKAQGILKNNLAYHNDWIVLNTTMQTLGEWAQEDAALVDWLKPHLERHSSDKRKSVAKTAKKILAGL